MVLEIVETPVKLVPPPVDGQDSLFTRERIESRLHFLDLETQHVDASVIASFGQRLHGSRKTLDLHAELTKHLARAGSRGSLDILAQALEFTADARRYLVARFLAKALDLLGDLAECGKAIFLVANPFYVTGDRLIGLLEALRYSLARALRAIGRPLSKAWVMNCEARRARRWRPLRDFGRCAVPASQEIGSVAPAMHRAGAACLR